MGTKPFYQVWVLGFNHKTVELESMRTPSQLITLAILAMLFAVSANATEPVSKSRLTGVAIGGHDAVAYHQAESEPQHSAIEGAKTYTVEYKGAQWRFVSKHSSELFSANPDKYSPVYNGHCANALSLGEGLIRTDGTHWEIFEGNLYLFYAARGRDRWTDGNWRTYKVEADAAWKRLSMR